MSTPDAPKDSSGRQSDELGAIPPCPPSPYAEELASMRYEQAHAARMAYQQQQIPYTGQQQQPVKKTNTKAIALIVVAIIAVLALGSCAAGAVMISIAADKFDNGSQSSSAYSSDSVTGSNFLTLRNLRALSESMDGNVEDGTASAGGYLTGAEIEVGTYCLEGSQTAPSYFEVYEKQADGTYTLRSSMVYFGTYFYNLHETDFILYEPADIDCRMQLATDERIVDAPPYGNGVYRVGIDIPAGTYAVTLDETAAAAAPQPPAAYVMTDLDYTDTSIVVMKEIIADTPHNVQVTNGDYIELFAATMTPVDQN